MLQKSLLQAGAGKLGVWVGKGLARQVKNEALVLDCLVGKKLGFAKPVPGSMNVVAAGTPKSQYR